MPNIIFLIRDKYETFHSRYFLGEVFVDNNLFCYFGLNEISDASGESCLIDGDYRLVNRIGDSEPYLILKNNFDSSEIVIYNVQLGSGMWLSNSPQNSVNSNNEALFLKLCDVLELSEDMDEVDASVVSWESGAVIHLDAQSYLHANSAGENRISPNITLSDQWDFENILVGDSGSLSFGLPNYVYSLRIEYQVRTNSDSDPIINFKFNESPSMAGAARITGDGSVKRVCIFITGLEESAITTKQHRNALAYLTNVYSENVLRHTNATRGGVLAIDRIRVSYFIPDLIETWEVDNQLTRVRSKRYSYKTFDLGFFHSQWKLVSGNPVDISLTHAIEAFGARRLRPNHASSIHRLYPLSAADDGVVGLSVAPVNPNPIDLGVNDGKNGLLDLSGKIETEEGDGQAIGGLLHIEPIDDNGSHILPKGWPINRLELPNDIASFDEEFSPGSRYPGDISRADAIGHQSARPVRFGTGEFVSLYEDRERDYHGPRTGERESNGPIGFESDFCRLMRANVYGALRGMARGLEDRYYENNNNGAFQIKVTKAWTEPQDATDIDWAHAQGRAVNFIVLNMETGQQDEAMQSRVAAKARKFFHWVEHVPENVISGEKSYVHVAMRYGAPSITRYYITHNSYDFDKYNDTANDEWEQISNFDDDEILDNIINTFPGTSVATAALSYRYEILEQSIDAFKDESTQIGPPDSWKADFKRLVRLSHDFLSKFPNIIASENIRISLLSLIRAAEEIHESSLTSASDKLSQLVSNPAPASEALYDLRQQVNTLESDLSVAWEYRDFAMRYPSTLEGRIAMARLYVLETIRVRSSESINEYNAFLAEYPHAPQWNEIANEARRVALDDEISTLKKLQSISESNDHYLSMLDQRAAIVFRNRVEDIKDKLIGLSSVDRIVGNVIPRAETVYKDPYRARFLMELLLRKKFVAKRLENQYLDLYSDIGAVITDAMILYQLASIEIQIRDLSKAIDKSHLELSGLIIQEENATRKQIASSFKKLAENDAELAAIIDDGFQEIGEQFSEIDSQLEDIYENTEEISEKADKILYGQLKASVERNNLELRINERLDSQTKVLEQLKKISARPISRGKGSGGGLLGTFSRLGEKIYKSSQAEVGNLTAENIVSWGKDPIGTVRKRIASGDANLKVEISRGINTIKSNWLYKQFPTREEALMTNPGGNMVFIDRDIDFSVPQYLTFERPLYNQDYPVYFINGIHTTLYDARKSAKHLANLLNKRVRLIYNHSNMNPPSYDTNPDQINLYGPIDLVECIYDKAWPISVGAAPKLVQDVLVATRRLQENLAVRQLTHQIYNDLENGKEVRIVAHSQGTMITRNALLACRMLGKDLSKVICVLVGPAIGDSEMINPSLLGNLTWIVNSGDYVATLIGTKATLKGGDLTEHNFFNKLGDRYGGFTFSGKRTYVQMISPENLEYSDLKGRTIKCTPYPDLIGP